MSGPNLFDLLLLYDRGSTLDFSGSIDAVPIPTTAGSINQQFQSVQSRAEEYVVGIIGFFGSTLNVIEVTTSVDGTDITKKAGALLPSANSYLIYMNQQQSISVFSNSGTIAIKKGGLDLHNFGQQ